MKRKPKREKWRIPWYCMGCGLKVIYKDEEHVCVETESVPVTKYRALLALYRACIRLNAAGGAWDTDARYDRDQELAALTKAGGGK